MNEEHQRRPHYSGSHPHTYEEKYKELQPEKYADTVEKVIAKGSTPAGMHLPIAVDEILDVLKIKSGESGIDCTLGYGGHTRAMLAKLDGQGHLCGLDVDSVNLARTAGMLREEGFGDDVFTPLHLNFSAVDEAAEKYGPFDFLLADLGVSSMQLDDPKRGFSWKREGPLDLRLDPASGMTAAQRLKTMECDELEGMLVTNADEPYAAEIAGAITAALKKGEPVNTTAQLRKLVEAGVKNALAHEERELHGDHRRKAEIEELVRGSCQRTFQALRIDINGEYEALQALLEKLPAVLREGGRAAFLTFHSGEDRIVKKELKRLHREGLLSEIPDDVTRPSAEEMERNPRARSAKLRWAIR
ncbi:MAG: 16S rRNA (cytosine(1402)-N(4))-methyltransferase RsmH [Lachnospiraceae bacterium]|jgi:16S rRNA (cytosine1402-N4)-methyltransferase|nr:16S rRNA (cytosine(1402)-N(4))-methyltransferase RsmH [Lachnospiraceae bacterium]